MAQDRAGDNATLNAFTGAQSGEGEPDEDCDAAVVRDDGPEPVAPVLQVRPEGTACPDCDTTVTRRWRDGDRYVCVACVDRETADEYADQQA
ncbi:MAG: hypothetical protein ABEJ08_04185 [Halobacteriaceae archaeon]